MVFNIRLERVGFEEIQKCCVRGRANGPNGVNCNCPNGVNYNCPNGVNYSVCHAKTNARPALKVAMALYLLLYPPCSHAQHMTYEYTICSLSSLALAR